MDESNDVRTRRVLRAKSTGFRWFVRLAILLVVVVVAAHAAWRWHAGRALDESIGALQAAGERVLPAEFRPPDDPLSRDVNGAPDLDAAYAILDDQGPESDSVDWAPTTLPVNPRAWPYLESAKAWFEPALRRIERAQTKPHCRWTHKLEPLVMDNLLLPELTHLRGLSSLLWTAALVEHRAGADAAVVRRLGQMLYLADAAERSPSLVAHLVAVGIVASAAARIEAVAPELRIGPGAGDASPAGVRTLIEALADETRTAQGLLWGLDADRMIMLDLMRTGMRGRSRTAATQTPSWVVYVADPIIDTDARRLLGQHTAVRSAVVGAANWPAASAALSAIPPLQDKSIAASLDPVHTVRRSAEAHFLGVTDRRLATTALAIRLYRLDHAGRLPARLDDLVPSHLPSVPLDPMAGDGRPLGYLPRPEDPVLYSVGRNGADDRASEAALPKAYGELDEWRRLDRVFHLGPFVRPLLYVDRPDSQAERVPGVTPDAPATSARPPWERDSR